MAVSYQEIGRRIASYRNELGLSQEVVAERMGGISRAVLSKIENGQKAVNAMELQAACTALGVDLNDLIEERPHSLVSAFMGSAKTEPARQAISQSTDSYRSTYGSLELLRGGSLRANSQFSRRHTPKGGREKEHAWIWVIRSYRRQSLQLPRSYEDTDHSIPRRRSELRRIHRSTKRSRCCLHKHRAAKRKAAFCRRP